MINPELGTMARPDITGVAKYDAAAVPPAVQHNGISMALPVPEIAFSVPWGALWVRYDFPETKFSATGYEVEVSTDPKFEDQTRTGISGSPPAGDFNQIVLSMNPYDGVSGAFQPNTEYFARVRATFLVGVSAWSESAGMSTRPLPQGDIDGPIATVVATVAGPNISWVTTAAPNPVSLSPVYDYRGVVKGDAGHSNVSAEAAASRPHTGPGDYTVFAYVTDVAGRTTICSDTVTVPEA